MHRTFAALCALAGLLAGCTTNRATGQRPFSLISEGQEIQMGLENDTAVVASMGLDPDSGRQRYVRDLGMRLALNVQPRRVQVVNVSAGMTLDDFVRRYRGPATPAATARLNNIDPAGRLAAGPVKRIVGQPLP